MKSFKAIFWMLALVLSVTFSYAQSKESKDSPKLKTSYDLSYDFNSPAAVLDQEKIKVEVRQGLRQSLNDSYQDISPIDSPCLHDNMVYIPARSLKPGKSWYANNNRRININILPSTYPGQGNYFNSGYSARPLVVPFHML